MILCADSNSYGVGIGDDAENVMPRLVGAFVGVGHSLQRDGGDGEDEVVIRAGNFSGDGAGCRDVAFGVVAVSLRTQPLAG